MVVSDARFSATSVANDARMAAKMVADNDRDETQRQAQVAADQRLAARLDSAGPLFSTAPATSPPPVGTSSMTPMQMYNVLQKSELPIIAETRAWTPGISSAAD